MVTRTLVMELCRCAIKRWIRCGDMTMTMTMTMTTLLLNINTGYKLEYTYNMIYYL